MKSDTGGGGSRSAKFYGRNSVTSLFRSILNSYFDFAGDVVTSLSLYPLLLKLFLTLSPKMGLLLVSAF